MNILGVTVNHNTSHFVELMLRTLYFTNDLTGIDLRIIVLDNSSEDEHFPQLAHYLDAQEILLVQTGLDNRVAVEKHGVALIRFVQTNPNCTHYLLLDSDIWFVEPDTLPVMIQELDAAPGQVFANQARIYGYYAGRVIEGRDGFAGADDLNGVTWNTLYVNPVIKELHYTTRWKYRCSPACSLVANSPTFQKVVETIGLNPAVSFAAGEAGHYDTFGLMTHVMATHGFEFIVSSKTIYHFTDTAYRPELRAMKDRDCLNMLGELRAGRGMEMEAFTLSGWVKQNPMNSKAS